jgi:hypothetical protein
VAQFKVRLLSSHLLVPPVVFPWRLPGHEAQYAARLRKLRTMWLTEVIDSGDEKEDWVWWDSPHGP